MSLVFKLIETMLLYDLNLVPVKSNFIFHFLTFIKTISDNSGKVVDLKCVLRYKAQFNSLTKT